LQLFSATPILKGKKMTTIFVFLLGVFVGLTLAIWLTKPVNCGGFLATLRKQKKGCN